MVSSSFQNIWPTWEKFCPPLAHMQADPGAREPLVRENVPEEDEELGEQTWPTEGELQEAQRLAQRRRGVRRSVPEGMLPIAGTQWLTGPGGMLCRVPGVV